MGYVAITDKDVAKSIATEIEQETGNVCEAFANETGSSVIVYDRTKVIARVVTQPFPAVTVSPLCGPFVGSITKVPPAARTFSDIEEAARALDIATSHVLNAALNS